MKKILSVLLSILLVFSTISVVFTLPTSAKTVTYTVLSEDFEDYNLGDAPAADYEVAWKDYDNVGDGKTGYFKGGLPTESGWIASSSGNKTNNVVAANTDTVVTTNTTQYLKTPTWGGIGVAFDVTANTTYTLTFKEYCALGGSANYARNAIIYDISDVTEGFSYKSGVQNYDNTALPALLNNRASQNPNATWNDRSFTFTTDGDATKALFFFKTDYEGYFVDDITVSYTVEVGLPVVTTTTTGADTQDGGVACVEEVGNNFVFTAIPYENATFTGWFRNNELVSNEATLTEALTESGNIEARFNANYKNAWTKSSFEEYTSATENPSSGSATGVLAWGTWNATDYQTINAEGWVGTCYGRGYIADNTLLNKLLSGAKAYSGNKALVHKTGSHYIGKVVEVEPNKEYTLTFYTYSQDAGALTGYKVIGIDASNGTVGMGASNMVFSTDGTKNNQTLLTVTPVSYDNQTARTWVKQQIKFNTGDYENVLITFSKNGSNSYAGELFIDHISLYADLRLQPEVTTTTVGNGTNGGYAWVSTGKVNEGDDITYNAKPYANAKFIGWYKNGELYRTEETFTEAYNSETYLQLEARFDAFATNIDTNGSLEDYSVGLLFDTNSHRSPWSDLDTVAYLNIDSTKGGIVPMYYGAGSANSTNGTPAYGPNVVTDKSYSGNKAIIPHDNGHTFFKVYDVEANSTYHFSYWYYQDASNMETEGGYNTYPDAALIAADADKIYIKGTQSNTSNTLITNKAEGQVVTDLFIDTPNVYYKNMGVVGEWTEVRYTFLTGDTAGKVVIPMPSSKKEEEVYFDHFTLYKEPEFESAYSLAVVPDTQKFNDDDVVGVDNDYDINAAYSKLYDDILAKKDSKNIQMVIGLGDITENSFTSEYTRAKAQFDRLDAANLPYTALPGNHDYLNQFKQQIPYEKYKSTSVGSYNGLANTYHKFTANGIKYLVLTLQYGAPDDVLAWATDIVEANPDYNVIVTTHGYLKSNGQRLGEKDGHSPGNKGEADENGNYESSGLNHSTDIWNKFVSKHENIVMVLCGHIEYDGIRITESYGDNGNKVLEMLIDSQGLDERARDENLREDTSLPDVAYALVAYFNFSADGKKLNIEYYSTNLEKLFYEITVDLPVVETEVETLTVVSGNNGNVSVNGKLGNNVEYKAVAGTEVTLFAEAYEGVEFLGWFDGETELSTATTYTTTIATKTITAKFEEKNIVADSSFENLKVGDSPANWTMGASTGTWAKAIAVDSVNNPRTALSALPYSGNRMLAISHRNNAGLYYEIDVDKYADYTLSLKWLLTLSYGDLQYNEADVASNVKYIAIGTADQTYYQAGNMIAEIAPGNSNGLWKEEVIRFSTDNNEKIRIFIEFEVGNADQHDAAYGTSTLYIDDLAVVKTAQGEVPSCEHTYSGECDAECNECGEVRDVTAEHTYTNDCDTDCNVCGAVRTTNHTYTDNCDTNCDVCDAVRTAPHNYASDCDTECNDCGNVRETTVDHTYTDNCDTLCDACNAERTAPHTYSGDCDTECNDCGNVRETTAAHTYADNCDTLCDVCNAERVAPHTYSGDCDTECNDCGNVREVTAEHTYTDNCDTNCDICNAERVAPHTYSGDCDTECNDCGNVREVTAEHTYTDNCDTNCDICNAERTAPHNYVSDCDTVCDDCHETRESVVEHLYDDEYDADCNLCGAIRDVPENPNSVTVTLNGVPASISMGGTATITVSIDKTITATSGIITISLGEGLEIVSGEWLLNAAIVKDFDIANGNAVFLINDATEITGDLFKFVVKGLSASAAQDINVSLTCKNVDTVVANGEANAQLEVKAYLRGDANGDGFITIKDITAIKRYLADWDGIAFIPEAADANQDGEVTIKDITYLKRHLADWDGYDLD